MNSRLRMIILSFIVIKSSWRNLWTHNEGYNEFQSRRVGTPYISSRRKCLKRVHSISSLTTWESRRLFNSKKPNLGQNTRDKNQMNPWHRKLSPESLPLPICEFFDLDYGDDESDKEKPPIGIPSLRSLFSVRPQTPWMKIDICVSPLSRFNKRASVQWSHTTASYRLTCSIKQLQKRSIQIWPITLSELLLNND